MLDISSRNEYFLTTREGPYEHEAPFPPPTNREHRGWLNSSFSLEVTMFYVQFMFQSSLTVIVFMLMSGLQYYNHRNDRE